MNWGNLGEGWGQNWDLKKKGGRRAAVVATLAMEGGAWRRKRSERVSRGRKSVLERESWTRACSLSAGGHLKVTCSFFYYLFIYFATTLFFFVFPLKITVLIK